jgi:hypothetical protein
MTPINDSNNAMILILLKDSVFARLPTNKVKNEEVEDRIVCDPTLV